MAITTPPTKNAALAGVWTFAFSAFTIGLGLLTGWLTELTKWLTSDEAVFPDWRPLIKVAVAFILAAVIGGVNFLYRWLQTKPWFSNLLPGSKPTYGGGEGPVS